MPTNPQAETAHERDSGKSTLKVQPAATARLRLQPRGAADEHSHTRRIRARRQPPATALFSADAVSGPTIPSGESPFACWNAITAASVS